ncbi:MAG: hypothetical protein OWR62_02200 [Sulfobacillus thermotolerans]|uniref:Uncharacterized protein n=1 Tax=Sulfobacillus thermotolerans TaxID=338644 RepID=A0ABM6RNH1_9FIRM|nr:hypothetical protein BXT84_02190 [Sulfobacillus thermotolerans]MCY0907181.1 hypothetical protein [Sulfobacillus thermotolerans]
MPIRRFLGVLAIAATALTGCGSSSPMPAQGPIQNAPKHTKTLITANVSWQSVSIGPEVLLNEGTAISSVLWGPDQRIYYGTSNPLGDSTTIGWYNFATHRNVWTTVPPTTAFPSGSGLNPHTLSLAQSAYWGAVDLVVSGSDTVWYRHWGYVGGWTRTGAFVPGDYGIPGPTVHAQNETASVYTSFQGSQLVRIMNTTTRHMQSFTLPSPEDPVAIAFARRPGYLWLLTADALWSLDIAQNLWTPVVSAAPGDFFVAMGHQTGPSPLWLLDANGNIGEVLHHTTLQWIAHLHLSPLAAQSATQHGLWIAGLRHLSLWIPGQPLQQWPWPSLSYPASAASFSHHTVGVTANWPPIPHIVAGPEGQLLIGYGTDIGQARVVAKRITISATPKTP